MDNIMTRIMNVWNNVFNGLVGDPPDEKKLSQEDINLGVQRGLLKAGKLDRESGSVIVWTADK